MKRIIILLFAFACSLTALEITPEAGSWDSGKYPVQTAPDGTIRFELAKQPKKIDFHGLVFKFKQPLEYRNLVSVSFEARSDQKIPLKLSLQDGKRFDHTDWTQKQRVATGFTRYEIKIKDLICADKKPLEKADSFKIGIALWAYDNTAKPLAMEFRNFRFNYSHEEFIVPKPTAAVGIDGEYRKDWGYEDSLYFWTPPAYITVAGENCLIGKKSLPEKDFSGKFSFMCDEQNLYFLALVKDGTPGQGGVRQQPWVNDSIELFIAPKIKRGSVSGRVTLASIGGAQIIFDCGDGGRPMVLRKGKAVPHQIQYSLKKCDISDERGSAPGYVLEAAIPFALFDNWSPKRGQLFGYCINLNGEQDVHLRSSAKIAAPHNSIENFHFAYLEQRGSDQLPSFKFGNTAANVPVTKFFNSPDVGHIWDSNHLPLVAQNPVARRYSLNGFWAVQGVENENASADEKGWFYGPVPGGFTWDQQYFRWDSGQKTLESANHSAITHRGKCSLFWYERTFPVPAEWQGKQLMLDFAFLRIEGLLYINGQYAGTLSQLNRRADITALVKCGETNRLDLRLYALNTKPDTRLSLSREGLTGDVTLEVNDYPARLRSVLLRQADGITGEYAFEINASATAGKIGLEILDPDGKSLLQRENALTGKMTFTGKCPAFPAWSIEKPQLCTAVIRRMDENGKLQEEKRIVFGFRTWENRDGRFRLNGKKVRLRTALPCNFSSVMEPGRLPMLKKLGFNAIYLHSNDVGWQEPLYNLCDRYGFMIMAPVSASASDKETVSIIHDLLHHPSIYGYISDPYGQFSSNGFLHNPFAVDDRYMPTSETAKAIEKTLLRRDSLFRSADPSRRYIAHATGNWRDTMRITHYYPTNGLNLLDRALYHTPWSNRPEKLLPLNLIEAGCSNLIGMDTRHPTDRMPTMENRTMVRREVFYEAASRYLGGAAFKDWLGYQNLLAENQIRAFRLNGVDAFCPWMDERPFAVQNFTKHLAFADNRKLSYAYFTKLRATSLDNGWMRTNTWYFKLRCLPQTPFPAEYGIDLKEVKTTPLYQSLYMNIMQPVYASITAGGEEIFTRDHNYYSGEKLRKSVTICNDTPDALDFSGKVSLKLGDRILAARELKTVVPQGEIVRLPLEFTLPQTDKKQPAELCLEYLERTEKFPLTIFPEYQRQITQNHQQIGVFSTNRISLPEQFGLTVTRINGAEKIPSSLDLIIIDEATLTRGKNWTALADFVNRGGRLLVMAQQDSGLLSHRLTEQRLEQVFRNAVNHPVLAGLSDEDLSFWRGRSGTVTNEVRPGDHYRHSTSTNLCLPHLTNRNLVAGYALRNFPYGRVTCIAAGGFDRDGVVLAEIRSGKGMALFCQMDIVSRLAEEPAAKLLAGNLLGYMLTPPPASIPAVCYSGNEADKAFLQELGVKIDASSPVGVVGAGANRSELAYCQTLVHLPSATDYPEWLRVKKNRLTATIEPYCWHGGNVDLQYIPLKATNTAADFPDAADAVFAGITPNDLFWFERPEVKTFSAVVPAQSSERGVLLSVEKDGKQYIFCAADPALVTKECEKIKIFRIWSQIFANLGVANEHRLTFDVPETDLSDLNWTLVTDPAGKGEKLGLPRQIPEDCKKYQVVTGKVWEEQGVTENNPHLQAAPGNAYDGYAWYIQEFKLSEPADGYTHFQVNGLRDVPNPGKANYATIYINGEKIAPPVGIWNGFYGGIGGRLWKFPEGTLKPGHNRIAIQIYNANGPGGIHKNPVRLEKPGKNADMLLPYRFNPDKYTNDFFWCW